MQPIAYLAALGGDDDAGIVAKATQALEGIAAKEPMLVFQRAAESVPLAFKLQTILAAQWDGPRLRTGTWPFFAVTSAF